jgi:hypothetical protein
MGKPKLMPQSVEQQRFLLSYVIIMACGIGNALERAQANKPQRGHHEGCLLPGGSD